MSSGDDACRVCCYNDTMDCKPLGNDTMMILSNGVPCQEDGKCENVSLFVCHCFLLNTVGWEVEGIFRITAIKSSEVVYTCSEHLIPSVSLHFMVLFSFYLFVYFFVI